MSESIMRVRPSVLVQVDPEASLLQVVCDAGVLTSNVLSVLDSATDDLDGSGVENVFAAIHLARVVRAMLEEVERRLLAANAAPGRR